MNKIIFCTPILNESESVEEFFNFAKNFNSARQDVSLKFLFITDAKSDHQLVQKLNALKEKSTREIDHLHLSEARGPVHCYLSGYRKALKGTYQFIGDIDAGGSHDVRQVRDFIDLILKHQYDALFGTRFSKNGGFSGVKPYRVLLSKLANTYTNLLFSTKLTDASSGFKLIKSCVLNEVVTREFPEGGSWQIVVKLRLKDRNIKEIPICYSSSSSSLQLKWVFIALLFLLKERLKSRKS